MKKILKQTAIFLTIVISFTLIAPLNATATSIGELEITSSGACVIDFDTGIKLFGYMDDTQRVPASMTKLISAYVVYDAIDAGEISMDMETTISRGVSNLSYNWEYSNVPLDAGATVTIEELLEVVLVWSACAATVALAEAVSGSETAFVSRMNEKVRSLGISASFSDCYGVSANNRISPEGMAILTRNLILDYPEVLSITSMSSVTFNDNEYSNTNQLLGEYGGIDGIKTGYTDAAGYCFTGTALRDSRRIIIVTMGSEMSSRFQDARILLDYGFEVAERVIYEHNRPIATPSNAYLILNNVPTPLSAYLIEDSHYFRLRDMAVLFRGTSRRFDVSWNPDERVVDIITGSVYSGNDDDLVNIGTDPIPCDLTPSRILIDGIEYELEVYLIGDNNYFKLRDLGEILDFDIGWIPEIRTVIISTFSGCIA